MIYFIEYDLSDVFNGYFEYLRNKSFNIKNTIQIIAEDKKSGSYNDKWSIIDPKNNDKGWQSAEGKNNVTIYFKKHRVQFSKYTVATFGLSTFAWSYPSSWYLEGSNDGTNFEQFDEKINISFCEANKCNEPNSRIFLIDHPSTYRFIRFQMTNESNDWPSLAFSGLEFFGIIQKPETYNVQNVFVPSVLFSLILYYTVY